MTLPFDPSDKNKRKYTCFVCGVMFPTFEDYKAHIVDKHEEGREFVQCPIEFCGAPVRDLRMHFKVKHPGIKMPEKGLMKAAIWKDFNQKNPRGKVQKPKFREGFYDSIKMKKQLHYRSGWEAKIYEYLDSDNDVIGFDAEPFEISYIHKGKAHKYVPDLIVRFLDGHIEIWEVKPSAQTMLEKNKDKWSAAHKQCQSRGWEFIVITEVGMDKLKNKVQKQLLESRIGK